jgi:GntR family transcriptional regulator
MTNSRRNAGTRPEFLNLFPLYLQVRNILVRRLSEGFAPGDRFQTEHQLCDEFGVSRETVREALRGLESDGLIVRHRGKGTFVARLPDTAQDERLTGIAENFTELKLNTDVEVLRTGVETPPARVASVLHLERDDPLFRIRRLRRVDNEPLAIHDAFLPCGFGTELARLDLTHTTLFRELRQTLGLKLVEIYLHIDAMTADVALAKLLKIEVGMPILVTRRALAHGRSALPTMFFEAFFRADRYYYSVQPDAERGRHAPPQRPPGARAARGRG